MNESDYLSTATFQKKKSADQYNYAKIEYCVSIYKHVENKILRHNIVVALMEAPP